MHISHTYLQPSTVHSKGDQPWDFFGRNDAKAETPVLWPPHVRSWLLGKDSDAGRDWGQEEKGTTEDEMAGWHDWLDGRESQWTPGAGDGQGGLACCDSWGREESDTTERLVWTELNCRLSLPGTHWFLRTPCSRNWGSGDSTGSWEKHRKRKTPTQLGVVALNRGTQKIFGANCLVLGLGLLLATWTSTF